MGTRSTVEFVEKRNEKEIPLLKIYQQYDGYLQGVGYELAEFLREFEIVNGFGFGAEFGKTANGTGCLAAQFVAKFKTEVGNLYITIPEDNEEYNYKVVLDQDKLGKADECVWITVTGYDGYVEFEGTPSELIAEVERRRDIA